MKDAKFSAEKWGKNLKSSTEAIREGVKNVSESPTQKAAAAQDKMLQNLIAAVESGKWSDGLKAVSLDDWKSSMEKGISRIPAGVDGAMVKMTAFMEDFLPYVEEGKAKIEKMPNVTLEDNIARATAMIRHNAAYKRKR